MIKKSANSRSRSQSRPPQPPAAQATSTTSQTSLRATASTSLTQQVTVTNKIEQQQQSYSSGIAFKELDIALKKVAKEQEETTIEVTLPRGKGRRARSLSRNNTETLPDEVSTKIV